MKLFNIKSTVSLLAFSLFCSNLWAQTVTLGQPTYAGPGCPQGSVAATLSPTSDTLSILYDKFTIATTPGRRTNELRSSCTVKVPVNLPQGYSMNVLKLDYRGFKLMPMMAQASITTRGLQMWNRSQMIGNSPKVTNLSGPSNDIFFVSHNLDRQLNSYCGSSFILEFTTELRLAGGFANRGGIPVFQGDAQLTLDSADLNSPDGANQDGAHFQVQLNKCR